jgi:hypothetical protein
MQIFFGNAELSPLKYRSFLGIIDIGYWFFLDDESAWSFKTAF